MSHLLPLLPLLSVLLHLTVSVPFFFKEQPKDAVVDEKAEARLNCIVETTDGNIPEGATYTWYKSDKINSGDSVNENKLVPLAGYESSVLYYPSVSRDATGYYHCKVETTNPPYKIFSSTAKVVVHYFDMPAEVRPIRETLSDNQEEAKLTCNTVASFPETAVVWKKNGETVSDPRVFVFPADTYVSGQKINRGTLLITTVNEDKDKGTYQCFTVNEFDVDGVKKNLLLSSYEVKITSGFEEPKQSAPGPVFTAIPGSGETKDIPPGGTVEIVCAAKGYPTPSYSWFIVGEDETVPIRGSDTLLLEDHGRRLVSSNIMSDVQYRCLMENRAKGRDNRRETNFYISITKAPADYTITVAKSPTPTTVLMPNQYKPFSLDCYVEKTGQNQILWLKNGVVVKWNSRRKSSFKDEVIDGVQSQGSTLHFEPSNESDLGVYQCIIVNSERLKTLTAFVTLKKDTLKYTVDAREPEYIYLPGPYRVDEAEEACNKRDAHLVSILGNSENQKVQQLAAKNNAASVWIGLTREVPEPVGSWVWTLSEDPATTYSNWDNEKPDNKYGSQEYTILSTANGKWTDVDKTVKRPAVCKKYRIVCPAIDEYYKGRVRARGWESVGATYEVGQQVEVFCRFPGEKALSITSVTCLENAQFDPPTIDECPEVPSSSPSLYTPSLLLLVLVIHSLLRTS